MSKTKAPSLCRKKELGGKRNMKINKKLILIFVLIGILIVLLLLMRYFYRNDNENKDNLFMVSDYLNSKYNMDLKIKDYEYYDNGDWGINAGKHYIFVFEPINGFELNARLDYLPIEKESLDHLILNITNIEKASELKKYVEENSNLKCKVVECRKVEKENNSNYYYFKVELDNDSNYWIIGKIYNQENFEDVDGISISSSLEERYNLSNIDNVSFQSLLNEFYVNSNT